MKYRVWDNETVPVWLNQLDRYAVPGEVVELDGSEIADAIFELGILIPVEGGEHAFSTTNPERDVVPGDED